MTLPKIIDDLKKMIPSCKVTSVLKLISGESYFGKLKNLDNKDIEVGFWIMKQMCHHGWEPFETHGLGSISKMDDRWVKMRRSLSAE